MLATHPETYKTNDHFQITVTSMHDQINSNAKTILWVLFAAAGLLFVIACSNVANLILARTVRSRTRTRHALGLGRNHARTSPRTLGRKSSPVRHRRARRNSHRRSMVAVLARYAARFSARAAGLTLDFSLLWIGVALAFGLRRLPGLCSRLPNGDASRGFRISAAARVLPEEAAAVSAFFAVTQITASFLC